MEEKQELTCSQCGEKNPYDSIYCEFCGKKIKNGEKTNPFWKQKWLLIPAIALFLIIAIVTIVFPFGTNTVADEFDDSSATMEVETPVSNQETTENIQSVSSAQNTSNEDASSAQKKKVIDGAVAFYVQNPDIMTDEEKQNALFVPSNRIYFEGDGLSVSKEQRKTIATIAHQLESLPDGYICLIVGFQNPYSSSDEYSMKKSEKRAKVVANILETDYNVSTEKIIVLWKGKSMDIGLFDNL